MVNQQLLDYIKQQVQQGLNREQIKKSLLEIGWQEADINEAFTFIDSPNVSVPPESAPSQLLSALPQQPERRTKKTLLAVILIIGVLIFGGGAFGYFYYFRVTPEKVIEKMMARLSEVNSLEYQGEIETEITAPDLLSGGQRTSGFSIDFSGKSDISDLNNEKGSLLLNIRTDALKELMQGEFIFGLEIRTIGQVVYFKLNNLPDLGIFNLSFLTNQWFKFDLEASTEKLKKQLGLEGNEEEFEELKKKQELSPEQIEKLEEIVAQSKVFKITGTLPSEKIEGVNTHHYKFLIDKAALKKLIIDISTFIQNHYKTLTEEELAEFDKGLEIIESIDGEIWIGKKDYLPYKISLTMTIKETSESKTAGKSIATLSFKNYNKPVQIDVPSPAKDMLEVLGELFGGFFSGTKSPEFQSDLKMPAR